ncbi:MAG: glycosyltransferase [Clostridium sp.]|nr:glycosyltransferase [Clostridium sp.]
MDKVSVIMPVHNAEAYIEEAIQSVLAQTYTNWELLVVDDCSTDRSVEVMMRYVELDSRIRMFTNPRSSGMPGAPRNRGLEEATGRFIAFLDSDDVWLPDKLEQQIPLFDYPDTAIVYSNYEKITEEGERNNRLIIAPTQATYGRMLMGNVIGNLTGIYDTSKVGKIYFRHIHHEDYVLWLYILKQGFVARNTGTVVALYRVRTQSVSSRKFTVLPWQWNIYINVEKTGYVKAAFYFVCYAFQALRKSLI